MAGAQHTFVVHEEPSWKWLAVPTAVAVALTMALAVSVSVYAGGWILGGLIGYLRAKSTSTASRLELEVGQEREQGRLLVRRRGHSSPRRLLGARIGAEPEQLVLSIDDGSTLDVRAKSAEEAKALLSALGPLGTVVSGRVPKLGDVAALAVATIALAVAIVVAAPGILWPLAAAAPIALAAWLRGLAEIVAGNDGLRIRSLRGDRDRRKSRFVAYGEIARVEHEAVVTRAGERIPLVPDFLMTAFDPSSRAAATAMLEQVERGVAGPAASEPLPAASLESSLATAEATPEAGFREASVPNEDLWRLLEHHEAELGLRSRAAELLRRRVAPEELRVRVADLAKSSARDEARETLFRIAEQGEVGVEESQPVSTARSAAR